MASHTHTYGRLTELPGRDPLAVGVDREALDVVVVPVEESLALRLLFELILIQHDAHGGGVIDHLSGGEIEQIRGVVLQPGVAVHVLQRELRVRGFRRPHDVLRVELVRGKNPAAALRVLRVVPSFKATSGWSSKASEAELKGVEGGD